MMLKSKNSAVNDESVNRWEEQLRKKLREARTKNEFDALEDEIKQFNAAWIAAGGDKGETLTTYSHRKIMRVE